MALGPSSGSQASSWSGRGRRPARYDKRVNPIDTLAIIGEMLSWVGLGVGLPLLLAGALIRSAREPWEPVEIVVVRSGDSWQARWFAGGDFRERALRRHEAGFGEGCHGGYVSSRRPGIARFTEPPATAKACSVSGGVLTVAGVLGLAVSWLSMLV